MFILSTSQTMQQRPVATFSTVLKSNDVSAPKLGGRLEHSKRVDTGRVTKQLENIICYFKDVSLLPSCELDNAS